MKKAIELHENFDITPPFEKRQKNDNELNDVLQ